jgi:hypothetical protein
MSGTAAIGAPSRMRPDDMVHRRWLELFHSFISVKHLEISDELVPFIAAALQGLTEESATEVFPMLNSLSIVNNGEPYTSRAARRGIGLRGNKYLLLSVHLASSFVY